MSTNPFHDFAAHWWDVDGPFHTLHDINPLRLEYIRRFTDLNDKHVLDLGCGGGILSEALAQSGAKVMGIDIESNLIDVAKHHAKLSGLDIDYRVSQVEALQHPGFDVIVCMEMLEHVTSPENIIAQCSRLLKPGGYLFLSTINRTLKAYLEVILMAEYVLNLLPRQTHDYQYFIKPAEMLSYLSAEHFELLDLMGMAYQPFSRKAKLVRSVNLNYLMCAKKTD
jgi:2-polyprenyl-6-hydroxyphenyl methylase/3-demethylubiquinone-9 3-methyltransferase